MMDADSPRFVTQSYAGILRLCLHGRWVLAFGAQMELSLSQALSVCAKANIVQIDLSNVSHADTSGAYIIAQLKNKLGQIGRRVAFSSASTALSLLLENAQAHAVGSTPLPIRPQERHLLVEIGQSVERVGIDLQHDLIFLGRVIASLGRVILKPTHLRLTSIIHHMEYFAFRALPIILLINFLVGCIVAQQGLFQLQRFGAATFVVDLIGILILRELGVLLTSIMVAGRTGSSVTAELGSMKMHEEMDALRVMGLDPIAVLVIPRLIALILSLPLLTFLADLASLFGGLMVSWTYGGISPQIFLSRLKDAIALNTFMVGLIKAPVMAFAIGIIACREGLDVQGSAESLGRQVTISVVRSIFVVIVIDGLFAMFFAFLKY